MQILKWAWALFVFLFLTAVTQVGGVIYWLSLFFGRWTNTLSKKGWLRAVYRLASFFILYGLATFLLVPLLARPLGRVPLPLRETHHLQPLNGMSCLLNRHYVRADLKQIAFAVAEQMNERYPETKINYLDANFPFFNGFPLLPHLSHNDGEKLDLAFCYRDSKTGEASNGSPSFSGYGVCEEARAEEKNTADFCAQEGYWQYSILNKILSQAKKADYVFDAERTKALVELYASDPKVGKIFIEPHLKGRLGLNSDKIRFHGCGAVRHDDHIHVQLK